MFKLTLINNKIDHKYLLTPYTRKSIAIHNGVKVLLAGYQGDWLYVLNSSGQEEAHLYRLVTNNYNIVIIITYMYKDYVWAATEEKIEKKIVKRLIRTEAVNRLSPSKLYELIAYGNIVSV